MKQLIDASKIKDIIEIIDKRKRNHTERIHSYGYSYGDNIDDTITHAKAIKELEQIVADIKDITPTIADFKPVYDAVVTLGGLDGANIAGKYIEAIKTIADYLGIDLDAKNAEDDEE